MDNTTLALLLTLGAILFFVYPKGRKLEKENEDLRFENEELKNENAKLQNYLKMYREEDGSDS
jgi:hypothetical protein